MSWTNEDWSAFCVLLDDAWPGQFSESAFHSWRALLDGISSELAVEALRRLLYGGQRFRPSVAELLAACRADASRPTFDEALGLIYRTLSTSCRGVFADHSEMLRAEHRAIRQRASELHPLVASFIECQGIERLRSLPLDHPTWGEKHRKGLQEAWERHVEVGERREVAALASGGLRQLDPTASLQIGSGA